jgi:hypothetical protein
MIAIIAQKIAASSNMGGAFSLPTVPVSLA